MPRIALAHPSEKIEQALADWVAYIFAKKLRDEAPIVPKKVRAGDIVREPPPVEEYNNIKRSVTRAKLSIPYMKEALENPNFDIKRFTF